MLLDSPAVDRLVEGFRRLPGLGKRSAERIALYLLSSHPDEARELAEAVAEARRRVRHCSVCRNLTEEDPCRVCSSDKRDRSVLCVVEQPSGAIAIERGGAYRGLYHVLHGVISPLDGVGPEELGIEALVKRLEEGGASEVIVATNATVEGQNTALYLNRRIAPLGIKVSRIAQGVPMGSGLEYADDLTLSHALEGRTAID